MVSTFAAAGQNNAFTILTNNSNPVQFCKDSVFLAEKLTIEGTPNITGMKVSFSENYMQDQDELIYKSSGGTIAGKWFAQEGYLILSGSTNLSAYEAAIRNIKYYNKKSIPKNGTRKITISLNDVDYLPATGHFYRYVNVQGIAWSAAKTAAEGTTYYGLHGYLTTITSAAENDFIQQKTKGVGWIGASDNAFEGDWRWVAGPEGLEDSGKGRLFWKGNGYQAKTNSVAYGPVNNSYHNWNRWNTPYTSPKDSDTWEPNDQRDEDYAHITFFLNNPDQSLRWNDLPDAGGSGDYAPQGYLIEFGGMPGDPVVNLTATIDLEVNTVYFDPVREFDICQKDMVTLNQKETTADYLWTPSASLSSASVSNPDASPLLSTRYFAVASNGICKDTASFKVNVIPLPISDLKSEENICKGTSVILDPGIHQSYQWNNQSDSQTMEVSTEGTYFVKLTSLGCELTDTVLVFVHEYPLIDLSRLDTLICGSRTTLADISTNAENYSLTSTDSKVLVTDLKLNATAFGTYPFLYQAINQYCKSDTLFSLGFHKIPSVDFSIDSIKCYGYNLQASYVGDAVSDVSRFDWIFGGDTIAQGIGINSYNVPLGINRATRDLKLKVTELGCSNEKTLEDIKVIPDLQIEVEDSIGCEPFTTKFMARNTEMVSYDWNFGDGNIEIKSIANPSHTYLKDGYYGVRLKVTTDKGCMNEVLIDSMVYTAPIPDVGFSLNPEECLTRGYHEISYTGTGNQNDTYNWDLAAFDPVEIIQNPGIAYGPVVFDLKNKPLATIALHVISEYGCQSDTGKIIVKRIPDFFMKISGNKGCVPLETSMEGINIHPVDQLSYSWDYGDGKTGQGNGTTHSYNVPDQKYNITVSAFSSLTGCSDILKIDSLIYTYPKPKADFSIDPPLVYNDKPDVKFENRSLGARDYSWDFGDGAKSIEENPTHKYQRIGSQKIILQVFNEYSCSDTISHDVMVAFARLFAPNAFSPSAPNEIDREFKLTSDGIQTAGYHLVILSRWNDIAFETKNEIKGWNGKMRNGVLAPSGSYIWILDYLDFLGNKHRQTGTVSLIY